MKFHLPAGLDTQRIISVTVFVMVIGGVIGYEEYRRTPILQSLADTRAELASTSVHFNERMKSIQENVLYIHRQSLTFNEALQNEQTKSSTFEEQIGKVNDTVTTINKLSTIDPQLLQKYSKVFFLNEHYTPSESVNISSEFLSNKDRSIQIHAKVWPFLEKLLKAAEADKAPLRIASGFRSFSTQATLKSSYKITYGAGTANQFSADQGYSEHQLGTTVDFTTPALGANFDNFDDTTAYTWLTNNAHKYGFVLSYPKNNTYYKYEPWHWRFVGVDLANKLHREGKYFYDLDQRTIDHYLLVFFE